MSRRVLSIRNSEAGLPDSSNVSLARTGFSSSASRVDKSMGVKVLCTVFVPAVDIECGNRARLTPLAPPTENSYSYTVGSERAPLGLQGFATRGLIHVFAQLPLPEDSARS